MWVEATQFFANNREKSYPYNSEIPINHQKVGQWLVQMKSTTKCNLGSLSTLFTLSFSINDMDFIHYIRGDTDLKVPTFLTTFCFLFFSLLLEYYWMIEKVQQSLHGYHYMQKLVSACTLQCSKDCRETWIRHRLHTERHVVDRDFWKNPYHQNYYVWYAVNMSAWVLYFSLSMHEIRIRISQINTIH